MKASNQQTGTNEWDQRQRDFRHHEKASETFTGDVPSPDMLNGNFNFFNAAGQQVGNTIYNPTTIRQNADGTWTSTPFAGNIIPKNMFDAVALGIMVTAGGRSMDRQ